MHIGVIGGIGPAATDYYYRKLIQTYALNDRELELTIVHADTPTLLKNLAAGQKEHQVAIYQKLAKRLKLAGAECVVVTSIAGHFCIEAFEAVAELPVINILTAVNNEVGQRQYDAVGIIGTKTVMETRFYNGISGAKMIIPAPDDLNDVHEAYSEMATLGAASQEHIDVFHNASKRMIQNEGAQAIMMGGTDLALVYQAETAPFQIVDCAEIHVREIFRQATK